MYSKFQEDVLEDLDELGEYTFILLIPYFLELDKDCPIIDHGQGIGEYSANYDISDHDFKELQGKIKQLFQDFDLGIYRYKDSPSKKWEDYHDLLTQEESASVLADKKNWIYSPNGPSYWIADKGGDKVEEYVANRYRSS